MEASVERISAKIQHLNAAQLVQLEHFVESLTENGTDTRLTKTLMNISEPSFEAIWGNAEDAAYDAI